ncbi:hypothetical protein DCCM_0844 [Desulfocucumis palustris]|uniref:Uncharacterized protein n=1 Tax=Desulfocucumis palustris TaxID=1898651 RepID=A0A2L2X947_9FIRM|nr:hypothetical protein [Desulfocucumis palustris]GBF32648.1 hypothetical protein DCCM_0844 [Desulfocucumis palustris]
MGGANPYSLFLILILLILGMDPDCDRKLGTAKDFVEKVSTTLNNLKTGAKSLHTDMESIHFLLMNMQKPDAG